jgi:hypothetical protein
MKAHWVERLQVEFDDLNAKIKALEAFMETDEMDTINQDQAALLPEQVHWMQRYADVLEERLHTGKAPT